MVTIEDSNETTFVVLKNSKVLYPNKYDIQKVLFACSKLSLYNSVFGIWNMKSYLYNSIKKSTKDVVFQSNSLGIVFQS